MTDTIRLSETIEHVGVDAVLAYAKNSRTHSADQVAAVARSIRAYGFTNPILIHGATIIAGHGRVMAAKQIGLATVPAIRLDHLTEAEARAYVIADNRLAELAGWDEAILAEELRALQGEGFDIDLTGFGDDDVARLFASVALPKKGNADPEAAPPVEAKARTRLGDLWALGAHRLLCGDSTDASSMAVLMDGKLADACWTDPPYNVAYETDAGKIDNDDMSDEDFRKFLRGFYRATAGVMKKGAAIYVAHADTERANFTSEFLAAGFKLSGVVIWRKDSLVLGRSDYQWIHEPILYGWKEGGAHKFYGGRKQTTVSDIGSAESPFVRRPDGRWQITIGEEVMIVDGNATVEWVEDSIMRELKPKRNDVHPTMKPVALIERMLRNSAKAGQVVLDPFGGSGSTMIACEQLGMGARLLELSPNYADVIVRRWQNFTGQRAIHAVTGEPFGD
jgi:DNA modification methylase